MEGRRGERSMPSIWSVRWKLHHIAWFCLETTWMKTTQIKPQGHSKPLKSKIRYELKSYHLCQSSRKWDQGLEFQRKGIRKMLGMSGKEGTKFWGGEGEVENVSDSQQRGNTGKSSTCSDSFLCSRLVKLELPSPLDTESLVKYLSRTT